MSKSYREMSDDEIKAAAKKICQASSSEDVVRRRLRDEVGYPYQAAITSHSSGPLTMFMVMLHGPRGNTISV